MKNILLAISGLNPQVITETLYALHQNGKTVHAIHVITTRKGKEIINANVLSPKDGKYYQYLQEYGIDPASIDFGYDNVHTVKDGNGIEIDDIVGEEENEFLLRKCLELTFKFTKDPNTAVFFSIAGGRKTMSACLGLAAQLYARPQDRVYHVLVTPEFESCHDFYYPPKKSRTVQLKDENGNPYFKETKYAEVNLVHLPFVSIRDQIADELLQEPKDPATLMLSIRKEDKHLLTVDLTAGKIVFKGMELDVSPSWLALYAFLALQKRDCAKEAASCRGCTECFLEDDEVCEQRERLVDLYKRIPRSREVSEMSDTGIIGLTPENFRGYRSRINTAFTKRFGPYVARAINIDSVGKRPDTKYGVKIDKERLRVVL